MREIDPFSYYASHRSVIDGLGGPSLSPNPLYCLHTDYLDIRQGPAKFELHLQNVRASFGELILCVHALRPDTGENASLVAGTRLDVGTDQAEDLRAMVAFSVMPKVQYALYGYFLNGSDIRADGLKVLLEEFDGELENYVEPPRSILAMVAQPREVRPANALIHVVAPRLIAPVSQDFTWLQLAELKAASQGENADDWAEALCRNALKAYGVKVPALEGVVVGPCSDRFVKALVDADFALRAVDAEPVPQRSSGLFGDFMVWPHGLGPVEEVSRRWDAVKGWFYRLKIGGLGIMTCSYRPGDTPTSSAAAGGTTEVTQNEIGRWALRLIGDGFSVAPLAFSAPEDLVLDAQGLARFAIIARRL